jgi:hypothetical protein
MVVPTDVNYLAFLRDVEYDRMVVISENFTYS